jgi:hypothetical protein
MGLFSSGHALLSMGFNVHKIDSTKTDILREHFSHRNISPLRPGKPEYKLFTSPIAVVHPAITRLFVTHKLQCPKVPPQTNKNLLS